MDLGKRRLRRRSDATAQRCGLRVTDDVLKDGNDCRDLQHVAEQPLAACEGGKERRNLPQITPEMQTV